MVRRVVSEMVGFKLLPLAVTLDMIEMIEFRPNGLKIAMFLAIFSNTLEPHTFAIHSTTDNESIQEST